MCVWQYNPKPRSAYVEHLQRLGFRVLVCPATSAWGLLVHPRTWNLQNLADSAHLARRRRVLGMINTVWCPHRYFPGVTLFGVAYGAVCRDARQAHPQPPYARFVRDTFGIAAPAPVPRAIKRLHPATPHKNTLARALPVAGENRLKITAAEHRALRTLHNAARQALVCLTNARADVSAQSHLLR
jgi:hypothetical protein